MCFSGRSVSRRTTKKDNPRVRANSVKKDRYVLKTDENVSLCWQLQLVMLQDVVISPARATRAVRKDPKQTETTSNERKSSRPLKSKKQRSSGDATCDLIRRNEHGTAFYILFFCFVRQPTTFRLDNNPCREHIPVTDTMNALACRKGISVAVTVNTIMLPGCSCYESRMVLRCSLYHTFVASRG